MKIVITSLPCYEKFTKNLIAPSASIYILKNIIKTSGHVVNTIDPTDFIFAARECSRTSVQSIIQCYSKLITGYIKHADVLAFSCNSFNWSVTKKVIQAVRGYGYRGKIILGGIHPTYFYKHILDTNDIDFVVLGDGDISILELLEALDRGHKKISSPGIAARHNFRTTNNLSPRYLSEQDMKYISAPDYDSLKFKYNYNFLNIESSRGCYNHCSFCSIMSKNKWRPIELNNVLENTSKTIELSGKKFLNKYILFTDDCFTSDIQRASILIKELTKIHPGYKFFIEARVSDLRGDFLSRMDPSNFVGIQIGVECGYDEGLKMIKKGITVSDVLEICEQISKYNFNKICMFSFIIGYPWESQAEISETLNTIEFITKKYKIYCNINYLLLLPSRIWETRSNFGIHLDEKFYDEIDCFTSIEKFYASHPLLTDKTLNFVRSKIDKLQRDGLNVNLQNSYL